MRFIVASAAALALLGVPSSVRALDMCFNTGITFPSQTIIVAKRYSRPPRGGCKPLMGIEGNANLGGLPSLVSGTVCLNSAGDTLRVAYTVHPQLSAPDEEGTRFGQINLTYPSLLNGDSVEQQRDMSASNYYTGSPFGGPCFISEPIP